MDDEQFDSLGNTVWQESYGFVYRNLRGKGVSHFDAEDLAQDILETAYVHKGDVDPGRWHAWLLAVMRNKIVDRSRRSGSVHCVAAVPDAADPAPGPDELALREVDRAILLEAIAELPERDQHLVRVRYLHERSISETAAELGMSVGATKVALHRTRQRLREALADKRVLLLLDGIDAREPISERALAVLTPFVGHVAAETCIRRAAVTLGKSSDELTRDDGETLAHHVRHALSSLLPPKTIERIIEDIRGGAM